MSTPDSHTLLPWIARAQAVSALEGNRDAGEYWLRNSRAPERAVRLLSKAAVPASGTLDSDLDTQVMIGAYSETLRTASAAARLILDGVVRRVPLNQRLALVTSAPSGAATPEGHARPVSRAVLSGEVVRPVTVSSLLVLTREMLRDTSPVMESLFNRELRSVLGAALDAAFFDTLIGDGTAALEIPSSGGTGQDVMADLRAMLLAVNSLGTPQLAFVMGSDTAKMASSLASSGVPVFQDLAATGGTLLGLPAILSSGIGANELILIEGSCIAANLGAIEVLSSISADIEMADPATHDSVVPTAAQLVSMFATNSVAMRGLIVFGATRLRENAIVRLTDVAWGA